MSGPRINGALLAKGMAAICVLTAALLLLAGRVSYWQGWLFGAVNAGAVVIVAVSFSGEADILRERMRLGGGTKWWDAVILSLFGPLNLGIIVVAALDAGRRLWGAPVPFSIYPLAYVGYVFSARLHFQALRANRFYVSTVRIMADRGHVAVDSGPYRFVRHPGYLGIIVMVHCIALALGSWRALIPASAVTALIVLRTVLEDATLRRELPGYLAYSARVRHRLVPFLW